MPSKTNKIKGFRRGMAFDKENPIDYTYNPSRVFKALEKREKEGKKKSC